jgi:ComF family protein
VFLPAAKAILDTILPPLCLGCETMVGTQQGFCASCWGKIRFIARPFCTCCGLPFAYAAEGSEQCGACLQEKPHFSAARSLFTYQDAGRDLVLAYKHGDRTDHAPALARLLARCGGELILQADLVCPVPLHPFRLWRRRYNQSALLAHEMARQQNKKAVLDLLSRTRPTPSQGGLNRAQRQKNVQGVFKVPQRYHAVVKDKNILLLDDVMTTGATVNSCARALRKAGAADVRVLTLARVTKEE